MDRKMNNTTIHITFADRTMPDYQWTFTVDTDDRYAIAAQLEIACNDVFDVETSVELGCNTNDAVITMMNEYIPGRAWTPMVRFNASLSLAEIAMAMRTVGLNMVWE